jgi:transcriptional regulator GlxA family with amidase domain
LGGWLKVFGAGPATDVREGPILRIGLIVPPGFSVLSFAPLSVFEAANMVVENPFYEVHAVSMAGGRIPNSFGMEMETVRVTDGTFDTLLIGSPPDIRPQSPELLSFLHGAPAATRRIASICIGAFILGEAGLLDGRRATTHWLYANELQRRYPRATVEMDRIFIADGPIWTSAGMTAGIDLALGLVERDIGREKTRELARMLVVHHRRAGGQSQHSALLNMDATSDRVQTALQFARSNLAIPLTVEKMAEAARLGPRQFSRVFRIETGISPAKAIGNLRLEAARLLLEQGRLPVEEIANRTGFGDRERMRRSFMREFGQSPQSVRNGSSPLASF